MCNSVIAWFPLEARDPGYGQQSFLPSAPISTTVFTLVFFFVIGGDCGVRLGHDTFSLPIGNVN